MMPISSPVSNFTLGRVVKQSGIVLGLGLVCALSLLGSSGCGERSSASPAKDDGFARRVRWESGTLIPHLHATKLLAYCPNGFGTGACLDLTAPESVFVGAHGHVLFLDRLSGLLEYDSAGRFIRERPGMTDDPEGFRRVGSLAENADGTLTVWDYSRSRLVLSDIGGKSSSVWVRDPDVASIRLTGTKAFALHLPGGQQAGDSVVATITHVSFETGKRGTLEVPVTALASRREGSDMVEIPSLFFPTPIWTVTRNNNIVYVPPNGSGSIRIERYDASGRPDLLITGQLPVHEQRVTSEEVTKRISLAYYRIFHENFALAHCKGAKSLTTREATVECATIQYLNRVAQRSPMFIPSIENIVAMDDNGFSLKTSYVNADSSVAWFLVDSSGVKLYQLDLKPAERIIGGNTNRPVIAADSGYQMTVVTLHGSDR